MIIGNTWACSTVRARPANGARLQVLAGSLSGFSQHSASGPVHSVPEQDRPTGPSCATRRRSCCPRPAASSRCAPRWPGGDGPSACCGSPPPRVAGPGRESLCLTSAPCTFVLECSGDGFSPSGDTTPSRALPVSGETSQQGLHPEHPGRPGSLTASGPSAPTGLAASPRICFHFF
jgi:hypothetical protein